MGANGQQLLQDGSSMDFQIATRLIATEDTGARKQAESGRQRKDSNGSKMNPKELPKEAPTLTENT